MLQRFLLQLTHHLVRAVDRLRDLGPIAMFGGNGGGQPLIVGAHVRLQRGAARGKGGFARMDAFLLRSIQGETLVEKAVNLALDRRCRSAPQARAQHGGARRYG